MAKRYKFTNTNDFNKVHTDFNTNALGNKNIIVLIYAEWCPHCREMKPEWEKAVNTFKDNEDLVLAEINSDIAKYLGTNYPTSDFNHVVNTNLFGFPTIRKVSPKVHDTYKVEEINLPNRNKTELETVFKSVSDQNNNTTISPQAPAKKAPAKTVAKKAPAKTSTKASAKASKK